MTKLWKFFDGKKRNIATIMTTVAAICGLYGAPDKFITSINLVASAIGGASIVAQNTSQKRVKK